ncbi:unnamed protein product, partial [Linum tenue]
VYQWTCSSEVARQQSRSAIELQRPLCDYFRPVTTTAPPGTGEEDAAAAAFLECGDGARKNSFFQKLS